MEMKLILIEIQSEYTLTSDIKQVKQVMLYDGKIYNPVKNKFYKLILISLEDKFNTNDLISDGIELIKATPKLVEAQDLFNRRDWKKVIATQENFYISFIKDYIKMYNDGNNFDMKIYNNGFKYYYYKCQKCDCVSVSLMHVGGFQLGDLICDNCKSEVINSKYDIIDYSVDSVDLVDDIVVDKITKNLKKIEVVEDIYPLTIVKMNYGGKIIILNSESDNSEIHDIQLDEEPSYRLSEWLEENISPQCYGVGNTIFDAFEDYKKRYNEL